MNKTVGSREGYKEYCDTGAASGQSACGQTVSDYCGMGASGQCDDSGKIWGEHGYCNTGAASGQSACGQTECDDVCCC